MKKALLLIFSLIIIVSIGLSQKVNQLDSMGRKQGKWEKTYSNSAIRYQGQFKNNQPYGEFKYFFPTGNIKAISIYSQQGTVVHIKTFYLNGKILAKGKFFHQKKDSTWNYYSDIDGKLVSKENYSQGIKDGKSIVYFSQTGKPAEITDYKNGIKNGNWIKYFPNGSIYTQGFYIHDTLEGPYKVYNINGKIEIEGYYRKGLQDRLWITYDSTGKILNKQLFYRGILKKSSSFAPKKHNGLHVIKHKKNNI